MKGKIRVNYPADKAGHPGKAMRGIASPLPPLRIHPRPQDGVFCGIFINGIKIIIARRNISSPGGLK